MNIFGRLSRNSSENNDEEKIHNVCDRGKSFLKDGVKDFERKDYTSAISANHEAMTVVTEINTILQNNTGISNSAVKETKALKTAIVDQFTFYHDKGAQANSLKDYEKAANCYAVAASLETNTFIATFRLAKVYEYSKNYAKSRDVLNSIITKAPGNSEAYREIGYTYTAQADYAKAIDYLKKAIDLSPEDGTAHFFIAICYASIGDIVKAKIHGQKTRTFGVEETYQNIYRQALSELGI